MTSTSTIKPSRQDQQLAKESIQILSSIHRKSTGSVVQLVLEDKSNVRVSIPKSLFGLLETMLKIMAQGQSISILPADAELSTQQAAELLNVSRPHVVKLLETGEIPFTKVGSHRRIRLTDLQAYQQKLEKRQRSAMEKLAKQAQDLNLGY